MKEKFTAFSQRLVVFIFWQVTETRTGPLGCSNYDNLDTVSSVLVHSPENKVQLQGKTLAVIWILFFYMYASFLKMCIFHSVSSNTPTLHPVPTPTPPPGLQVVLPSYLQSLFIQAALNYIGCKSEGQFVCQNGDCWCECSVDFPQCNCPHSDLDTLEKNLLRIREAWRLINQEFEESGESVDLDPAWPSKPAF